MRFVVTNEMSDQRGGDAELYIAVEMDVIIGIDLRDDSLETGLVDQCMDMRRPERMPALRFEQPADHAIGGMG
ncbi:MAG: hypothetical protein JWR49_1244 [Tardiphaga sp.]|nr:hypothetical protein [Tardiphaga sp.]